MSENELIEVEARTAMPPAATTPLQLLSIAVQNGTSMEQMERLMALQERWEAGEARKQYNAAFAAFKAEGVKLLRNKQVTAGPLSGKAYAELHAVVNAITEALSRHGLSAAWKVTKDEKDWIEVTCQLRHIGGHSESVSLGGPPDSGGAKNAIQARASTITYLERYTLKAITGLSEQDDDDDGGHAERGDGGALNQPKYLGLPTAQRAKAIRQAAGAALEHFNLGDEPGMWAEVCHIQEEEDKNALWLALRPFSDCRAAIKRMAEEERVAQAKLEAERGKAA
jgi:hypothetical protein